MGLLVNSESITTLYVCGRHLTTQRASWGWAYRQKEERKKIYILQKPAPTEGQQYVHIIKKHLSLDGITTLRYGNARYTKKLMYRHTKNLIPGH
jgi:hypothetical protein